MNMTAPPVLTVRYEGTERNFAPGNDVVVGRDVHADIRVVDPLISRAHLLLRFERGKWVAIDNGSRNGSFVDGQRVPVIDIHDGRHINIGNPDGPCLSFEVGHHDGPAGRPPATSSRVTVQRPATSPPRTGPQPAPRLHRPPPPQRPTPAPGRPPADLSKATTRMLNRPRLQTEPRAPADSVTIGRASDNDIVIEDVLASRQHAFLIPGPAGTEIRDARSANGTFVNGVRVGSAVLNEGDVVTIGNVDLVFSAGTLVRRTEAATRTGGLEVQNVEFSVDHDRKLLHNISLTARPGTLTALIGGSGAGKSTLARLIAGYTRPSSGSVIFEGHDVHSEYAILRNRIGMVPQDDVVHRQLTVKQALGYAAELRLPPDTSQADRDKVVAQVLEELELTKHADTRVDKLSGGQRKRASVALELLTGPSLLLLDEPTSGLDPALDRQVMMMLRQLADAGRVVLVVTHSLTYLDVCDQVLLLAPGGKTAFCGPPDQIGRAMGTTNWADIFTKVGDDPDAANQRFLAQKRPPLPELPAEKAELGAAVHTSVWRQFSTIARRQFRLIVSDRAYFVFLTLLPFVMGLLPISVSGTAGLGVAGAEDPTEPLEILILLSMGAVFMGTALTIRDLIGERPIFLREQAVGLSTSAYLLAKICVFSVFATVQSAIMTAIVLIGKGMPVKGAVILGGGKVAASIELFVGIAGTCIASALVGLLLSALARSSEQVLPLLVVSIMSQVVLSGGMIPVTGRAGLDQLSWIMPGRWGFAASASTVGLPCPHFTPPPPCPAPGATEVVAPAHDCLILPGYSPQDSHWQHTPGAWLLDMGMLAVLSLVYAGLIRWRLRLRR